MLKKIEMHSGNAKAKRRIAAQKGFTLVEVLIGGGVLAVVFISIFSILTVGMFASQTSRENLRATQIMMDKMEGLRLYNPAELTNNALLAPAFTNWFYETNVAGSTEVRGSGIEYDGAVSISAVPFSNAYSSNMVQVTITLSWVSNGEAAMAHTRTMSTFFSQHGMANYVYNNF
jgi:Tfp pilus assembly protein PilV